MPTFSGSYESGTFDLWAGLELWQPSAPDAYRTGVVDANYFGKQVQDNVLALIRGSVGSPWYRQSWTCVTGLTTGCPVYCSDSDTVALAEATGSVTSNVIGFIRDKSGDTACYISHFWRHTGGSSGTTGAYAFLSDSGGVIATSGTVAVTLGVWTSTTGAILARNPGQSLEATSASSTPKGCKIYVTGTKTISSSDLTGVSGFTQETWNTSGRWGTGYHDTGTNTGRITIPTGESGYYSIGACVYWTGSATGSRKIQIVKSSGNPVVVDQVTAPAVSSAIIQNISTVEKLSGGDFLTLQVYQDSGANSDIAYMADYSIYFWCELIANC